MTARQLVQSGAGMLSMYSTPRSTAPRCFNCNTFIGEGARRCRVYVVHCLPGMLANGRAAMNPKAFDDYIAAIRKLGLVLIFDSPQSGSHQQALPQLPDGHPAQALHYSPHPHGRVFCLGACALFFRARQRLPPVL